MQTDTTSDSVSDTSSDIPGDSHTTRLGKIARLPATLRQTLNRRLEDHEPSQRLVDWLNSLPEVRQVLEALFEGRPISEQNLSAWKLGGFRDWQRYQQCRARARDFLEEARELAEEVSAPEERSALLDRVGDRMALALLQLFREAEEGEKGPTRTRTMLEIARELARLRRGDHERQQAEVLQQRWREERDQARQEAREAGEKRQQAETAALCAEGRAHRAEYVRGEAGKAILLPERERWIRAFFARHKKLLRAHGVLDLPDDEDLGAEVWWQHNPRGYNDWASPLEPSWTPPAQEEAASPDPSSPVKAAQGEASGARTPTEGCPQGGSGSCQQSSLEISPTEGGDAQTT